ncbi:CRISPR-associated helicase Cas3 [Candidatus Moduliflexus flocculans]|uniref:CRISPR-associated helicase Cas3 n=1 Tax=Candidatus Moduliflexus flocculans TaxID=1499966 RepID=A0A0S6W416_9BACT|nr:CRISPR-associated helicase Cas3 [Candidatus Moduliflexus flocculans]
MSNELLAHVKETENGRENHYLKDHLDGTARLAKEFASVFGLQKLADIVGKVHDFGKASQAFQDKINPEIHVNPHVDHSTAGAQFLKDRYDAFGILLAYIVAGHHGGLPNGKDDSESSLAKRLKKPVKEYRSKIPPVALPEKILPQDFITSKGITKHDYFSLHFLTRMLYSVLTDADFLDTETFMTPENSAARQHAITLSDLLPKLERKLANFQADTPVNHKRANILKWCRDAAQQSPGLFSLTVPTGGGKTLSSMAFALDHALKYNLRRIIYVIPYTSIITQNADVFRQIFGEEAVLEHHSNLDPKQVTAKNRLASQNWDAPIIVTTNVQFFESFYGNRSTACRKLHNVADSVIIFDEAQMLPPELLKPSLAVIRELTRNYGCTAILCTATQPTLSDPTILKNEALEQVREIIPNPEQLYEEFRRVCVTVIDGQQTCDTLGESLSSHEQVLAIVSTRKDARLIYEQLCKELTERYPAKNPIEECFHLSTMMCPAHRTVTLNTIRARLAGKLPCRVVSTQLIEAGVDVDFPIVWRAIAGLDSIAQAAGRCNREGKLERGQVVVFHGENKPPVGHLRQAAESGERILKDHHDDPLRLGAVTRYFEDFFWKQQNAHQMDQKKIMQLCSSRPDEIPFREIAQAFKMIDEPTRPILVPYGKEGKRVIEELKQCQFHATYPGYVNRELRKRLQQYTVNLYERIFQEISGELFDVFGDGQFCVLLNMDIYDEAVGLKPENPTFMNFESSYI